MVLLRIKRRLLSGILNFLLRPLSDVNAAIDEAESPRKRAALVLLSPVLFLYYAFYQSPEGKTLFSVRRTVLRLHSAGRMKHWRSRAFIVCPSLPPSLPLHHIVGLAGTKRL